MRESLICIGKIGETSRENKKKDIILRIQEYRFSPMKNFAII